MVGVVVGGDCLELRFEAPGRPLSINQANRFHWAQRKRELQPWRDAVAVAWKQARPYWHKVKDRKVSVEVLLPFPDKRRRDPHNYVGTVCKALIDELTTKTETIGKHTVVAWEGCWPDDNPEYVSVVEPRIIIGSECAVRICPVLRYKLPATES
jgi:hypothetical protein